MTAKPDGARAQSLEKMKFHGFVLDAFVRGDTRLTAAEIEQIVIACYGNRPRHLDVWIPEYRTGIELLETERG